MEGYLTYYYEYHFLYITGIEHVESKNIQGAALMKLVFHPGTDMSQAMAEVVGYVNRSRAFMPPGAVPPFIMRFDAGSVPVGAAGVLQRDPQPGRDARLRAEPRPADCSRPCPASRRRRRLAATSARSSCALDPERMRAYRLSPEEVDRRVNQATTVLPSGNVRTGDLDSLRIHQRHARRQTRRNCWTRRCAWGRGQPSTCGTSGPLRTAPTSSPATRMWTASAPSTFLSPSEPTLPRSSVIQQRAAGAARMRQCRAGRCEDRPRVRPVAVRRRAL